MLTTQNGPDGNEEWQQAGQQGPAQPALIGHAARGALDHGEIGTAEPMGEEALFGESRRVAGHGVLEALPGRHRPGLTLIEDDGDLPAAGLHARGKIRWDLHDGIESAVPQRLDGIGHADEADEAAGHTLVQQLRRKFRSDDGHT